MQGHIYLFSQWQQIHFSILPNPQDLIAKHNLQRDLSQVFLCPVHLGPRWVCLDLQAWQYHNVTETRGGTARREDLILRLSRLYTYFRWVSFNPRMVATTSPTILQGCLTADLFFTISMSTGTPVFASTIMTFSSLSSVGDIFKGCPRQRPSTGIFWLSLSSFG